MSEKKDFYLKFNVKDFRTDSKVCRCSANANGVYIHLICLLFDSESRGRFLLPSDCLKNFAEILPRQNIQQTNQQTEQQISTMCRCIAAPLVKHLPFFENEIESALVELLINNVLYLEGYYLCQKRMIKDVDLSRKRSNSGKKGADATNKKKSKPHPSKKDVAEDLPADLPQQKEQQKPNYNYNSNYNYKEGIDNEGVSNNTGGGTGEIFTGGEKEKGDVKRVELTKVDLQIFQKSSEEFIEAWIDWETHLVEQDKKPHTHSTRKASYEQLVRLSEYNEDRAIEIIRTGIGNRWVTFNTKPIDLQKNMNGNGIKIPIKKDRGPEPGPDATPEDWEKYWKSA